MFKIRIMVMVIKSFMLLHMVMLEKQNFFLLGYNVNCKNGWI